MGLYKNFAWPVTSINNEDYKAFERWFSANMDACSYRKIIIWGAGIRGTEFSIFFTHHGINNIEFTDNNSNKWGGYIDSFIIISPNEAVNEVKKGKALILISVEESKDIEKQLKEVGLVINKDFYVARNGLYDKYLEEFKRPCTNKYLIMGDCEFTTISIRDVDKRNLAEMIRDKMGVCDTKVLAMHGMGLRSHYSILNTFLNDYKNPNPRVMAIMINFDTLNGYQHLLPRSQHKELLEMLYKIYPNQEFSEYLREVNTRTKNLHAEFSIPMGNQSKMLKSRNYFKFNYLYDLNTNTEGIVYLTKIIELLQSSNVKIVPFIPPVNYKYAIEIFGDDFRKQYENNVSKIKRIIEEYNLELLDMSYELQPSCFAESETPDETANFSGREIIMQKLCSELYRVNEWE